MTDASLDEAFKRICAAELPLGERLALFTAAVEKHGRPFAYQNLISQLKGAEAGGVTPGLGDARSCCRTIRAGSSTSRR